MSGRIRKKSIYFKVMALNGCVVNVNFDELREANYELKKIGTNINQIAHKVNANDAATVSDVRKLQEDWRSVMRIISMKFLRSLKLKAVWTWSSGWMSLIGSEAH